VAAQRAVLCLGRGGGSPEPGVARTMGHRFRRGLTLRTWCIKGNSPRGSSNTEGDQSRACDGDWLAPTISDVDDKLQRSVSDEIKLRGGGVTHRRVMWCWLGAAGSPMEQR
jgi:hypothetical protein